MANGYFTGMRQVGRGKWQRRKKKKPVMKVVCDQCGSVEISIVSSSILPVKHHKVYGSNFRLSEVKVRQFIKCRKCGHEWSIEKDV